jgi:hypothetical protein
LLMAAASGATASQMAMVTSIALTQPVVGMPKTGVIIPLENAFAGPGCRGLYGVQLVISDAHAGLKAAIARVLVGAGWQQCRTYFAKNLLAKVPKAA